MLPFRLARIVVHTHREARRPSSPAAQVEIVARPEIFLGPALARLTDLLEGRVMVAYDGEFDHALPTLWVAHRQILETKRQMERGLVCRASDTFEDAARLIRGVGLAIDATILARRRLVAKTRVPTGDVGAAELRIATLKLNQALTGAVLHDVLSAKAALDDACDAVSSRFSKRGVVIEVDDEADLFRLDDGTHLAFADSRGISAYEGERISVSGASFKDGTGVATTIQDEGEISVVDGSLLQVSPCLMLRIAPLQPTPDFGDPWTLHQPEAYDDGGTLRLEQGMRFGVEKNQTGCKPQKSKGTEYSLRVGVNVWFLSETLTTSLTPASTPVSLPSWLKDGETTFYSTLTQRCKCARARQNSIRLRRRS